MQARPRTPRSAFTLVELLIVIAIIVILMALLLPAIMRVWGYVDEVRTATEVRKMAEGCELFKNHHHMYPPARIILRERMDYQLTAGGGNTRKDLMEQYSLSCLNTIFNGINNTPYTLAGTGPVAVAAYQNGLWHDWNGSRALDDNPMFLEGEEALVYWLSGIRYGSLVDRGPGRGFGPDVTRPTFETTGERKGPYFEFDARRITNDANYVKNMLPINNVYGSGGWFPVYLDRWNTPYAYFLARGNTQNNYTHLESASTNTAPLTGFNHPLWLTDCMRLTDINPGLGITPNTNPDFNFNYTETAFVPYWAGQYLVDPALPNGPRNTTYHMADKYQIVGAGRDRLFGTGGHYDAGAPETSLFNFPPTARMTDQDAAPAPPVTPAPPLPNSRKEMNRDNFTNFVGAKLVR